jgi:Bacterial Ig-like domain
VKGGRADAKISDALSVVTELAFSIDDEAWRLGTTSDGIFDGETEAARLDVPANLAKGTHTLSIRAADAAGNVAAATTTFVVR